MQIGTIRLVSALLRSVTKSALRTHPPQPFPSLKAWRLAVEILKELLSTNTLHGKVEWIGVSSGPRSEIQKCETIRIVTGGVEHDHHCRPTRKSKRQVTLIQAEHIPVVEAILRRGKIDPALLRRNIVVSGINLAALKYQRFRIGAAVLDGSGSCPPCSRMEENLGPGGYAAMLSHGGITAVVVTEGVVNLGDTVSVVPELLVKNSSDHH